MRVTEVVAIELKTGDLWIATYHPNFAQSWWEFYRPGKHKLRISMWPFWEEKDNFEFLGPLIPEKRLPRIIKWDVKHDDTCYFYRLSLG